MALDKDMIIPEHIALILDGNGHWAKKRGFPHTMGHKEGCITVEKTVELAAKVGIRYLTVYGFSTEDWKHSAEEMGAPIQLFHYYMVWLLKIASADNVRVKMIGDRSHFDRDIIEGINRLESETRDDTEPTFVIAVNYGGKDEICRAAAGLARDCILGKVEPDQVGGVLFASYLGTVGMPDPGLLIRTSGEPRLSNYLLWQLTYTEIVVTDCLWPDFGQEELEKVIVQYNKRERRFGAVEQGEGKEKATFTARLISGIILVLLSIVIVGQGGILLYTVMALISIIGLLEFYRTLGTQRRSLAAVSYVTACSYYGFLWFEGRRYVTLMIIAYLMTMMTLYVSTFPEYKTEEVTGAFFGVCYVPIMLSFLYQTRVMNDGAYLVWLIFLNSWGCDIFAYCTGVFLGRHKLAPVLSPKRSIEGAVGGVVDAALLGLIYASLFGGRTAELDNPQAACAITCAIAAAISQVGDLVASAIKRNHNIKDYGHPIPGHGGILDRFDSMIFMAPAIYFALTFLK